MGPQAGPHPRFFTAFGSFQNDGSRYKANPFNPVFAAKAGIQETLIQQLTSLDSGLRRKDGRGRRLQIASRQVCKAAASRRTVA